MDVSLPKDQVAEDVADSDVPRPHDLALDAPPDKAVMSDTKVSQPDLSCSLGCPGCCTASGACLLFASQSVLECGKGGVTCGPCGLGQSCVNGLCLAPTCSPTNCLNGCCDSVKGCITDGVNNSSFCGTGGKPCINCTATGGYCELGACTTSACGPCQGCCDNKSTCIPTASQTAMKCGLFGAPCFKCGGMMGNCCGGVCSQTACP